MAKARHCVSRRIEVTGVTFINQGRSTIVGARVMERYSTRAEAIAAVKELTLKALYVPDVEYIEESQDSASVMAERTHDATVSASLLIDLFVPPDLARDMQANLEELYPIWIDRHGERNARRVHLTQCIRMVGGHMFNGVIGLFERVVGAFKLIG